MPVTMTQAQTTLASASNAQLETAVGEAHLPSLIATLAYSTGDMSLLREDLRPTSVSPLLGVRDQGGYSEDTQEKARKLALQKLIEFRDSGMREQPSPTATQLKQIMEFMTGPIDEGYVPLLVHELALPVDSGGPEWKKSELAPDVDFTVVIVGAGMSGLAAAYRLMQAEIPFTIVERNSDVGGVWLDNGYPGARLDTNNFNYSYSFAQHGGWAMEYSERDEVLDYFRSVADRFDIKRHIRFNTTLTEGVFDETRGTWTVTLQSADGSTETLECNALVSAVGQLNEPNMPEFPGAEKFTGSSWHTARWDHDVSLEGKRVGIIGTGASAFQVIPKVAEIAEHVTVFQRTPAWVLPTPGYNREISHGLRWMFENLPHYHRMYRFNQFWARVDGIRDLAEVDPEWDHPVSVSQKNEEVRARLVKFLEESFEDRPDILSQIVPDYPPYAKRCVRDDGTWTSALKRPNVTVTSETIERLSEAGVLTADGIEHECDVLVYGTGFLASDFLGTMNLQGRNGVSLKEQWAGDARAYYGVTIPNFPNLFCIYGPNTNLNVNGSVVLFSELGVEYTLECIRTLLASRRKAMDLRWEPFEEYNERIDAASKSLATGVSTVNSWYKNAFGRVSQNWPLSTLEYWSGTRGPAKSDYVFL